MILVDTSVWIDFFRGVDSREAAKLANALNRHEDLAICGPILMEIRQGIVSTHSRRAVERRLSPLIYLPTRRTTYCRAADIFCAARAQGKTVRKSIDCLIAACAMENRVRLLHRDKDFAVIADVLPLRLVQPD